MARNLEIDCLRTLVAIADCGGFHRAAGVLHLTQSAVSQHVRRLEAVVGSPLFARRGRISVLTPAGEELLAAARRILGAHDDALVALAHGPARTRLTIGSSQHFADQLLPEVLAELREALPHLQPTVRLDASARVVEAAANGAVDLGLALAPARGARARSLGRIPLRWFAADPALAAQRPLPLILFDGTCAFRGIALDHLAAREVPWTIAFEGDSLSSLLAAGRAGLGALLLLDDERRPDGLVALDAAPLDPPPPTPASLHVGRDVPPALVASARDAIVTAFARTRAAAPRRIARVA
jgi:DNA-binding transcriptional LysR family regulator